MYLLRRVFGGTYITGFPFNLICAGAVAAWYWLNGNPLMPIICAVEMKYASNTEVV